MSMIRDWFYELKRRFGDAPALRCAATGRVLTFAELSPQPTDPVLVTDATATWECVLEILGALAAGSAVVPLNPRAHPARRLPGFSALESGETVIFTSGSSGEPRAVVIGFAAHLANARGSAQRIPVGAGDEWLLNLPLHHVSGLSILFRCLDAGACVVLPDGKSIPPEITHLSVVETQLARMVRSGEIPPSLKAVLAGGGPVALNLANAAIAAGIPLHLTYGMTETASQAATTDRLVTPLAHVHCGKALPGREVRIDAGGHIAVRGAVLAKGWLDPAGRRIPLTAKDGWYRTNDLGVLDLEGNLVVSGRSDRVIISGGEKIHPEMIERALMAQPGVECAVVLAVPHAEYGQRPVAVVRGAWNVSALRATLDRIAMPEEFVSWPEEIPPPEGKITAALRGQLRQQIFE